MADKIGQIVLTSEQDFLLKSASEFEGLSFSSWARRILLNAAMRTLKSTPQGFSQMPDFFKEVKEDAE